MISTISKLNFTSLLSYGFMVLLSISLLSCGTSDQSQKETQTWAEKLGFPEGKKILMIHADDAGMCDEANIAIKNYFDKKEIQGAAIMVPCPSADVAMQWAGQHPNVDVGLHLTLTSEWKTYRWGTVADAAVVPGLLDLDKKMWHEVSQVVEHASAEEVEIEIRAQIEKAISVGMKPSHIDTHMGSLYGSPEYVKVFLKVAEEYSIPANALELSNPQVVEHFKKAGYPITDEVVETMANYSLPKLDFFTSVPNGKTYEEKRENFFQLVKNLPNGLTEIIFHPSVQSDKLMSITNSWQQRVWEAELFSDPVVKKFFKDEGIVFTDYIDIMKRFNDSKK